MERVGRIAMHLVPAPVSVPILATPCAGWKMLPGPHPPTSNTYMQKVEDEKAFLSRVDEIMKMQKRAGGVLPRSVLVFKMDSGMFMVSAIYATDMDRVANMTRVRAFRDERATDAKLMEMYASKTLWFVSFVDERPMKMTGSRIATIHMAYKSPEHMERAMQLNPNGEVIAALGPEYIKAGYKAVAFSQKSDSSVMGLSVLSDESSYLEGREELMAKVSSAMGINLMDYLAAPPEREMGICVYAKTMDEI